MTIEAKNVTIGVLALQGAFAEHVEHLKQAALTLQKHSMGENGSIRGASIRVIEVRTAEELSICEGLVIPGGESTAISLVAERTGMLEPLRAYVHELVHQGQPGEERVLSQGRAVWGTCAGLILVASEAGGCPARGQEILGGLDVKVSRNHFGSQLDSFIAPLEMPILKELGSENGAPFEGVFIRAPVVDAVNISTAKPTLFGLGEKKKAIERDIEKSLVVQAPNPSAEWVEFVANNPVEVLTTLERAGGELCVAVRQGRTLGTSFHPELTSDSRLHQWWIQKCVLQA
ncbi:uncharacterized protein SAPINGB_P001037 [Magnusiomyces paraingens]|uniref:glutaminase n=1 Tax=Magnusiomyces paraingens TaxID=2606893 RepID=A0A5E8B4A3_9ASCO|nr:uncharacterized protein SAPINGB_P001037 [Saprochaete ingens]VVT46082.1 unnamed protein product [Saprochaete ingens]